MEQIAIAKRSHHTSKPTAGVSPDFGLLPGRHDALGLLAMTECHYDVVIIGGGVVGLAVALEITWRLPHLRLLLLEKEDSVARHQSGHNSGVIHSGVY